MSTRSPIPVSNYTGAVQKPLVSTPRAKQEHRGRGFTPYTGPLLEGPRTELSFYDPSFPQALRVIPRPPEKLYVIGNVGALQEGLAIIGARKATPYGLGCVTRFGRLAALRGLCIISGGARGCDAQAHKCALECGAPTVVVLGGGCDQLYPKEHYSLFQRVIDAGGAVISENPWEFPALPYCFRERNRLIAGLAKATLIVEAGLPSGTFSTADEALAASKDVLVVPGSIMSPNSAGANHLIAQGATPIVDDETFQDALFSVFGLLRQETAAGKQVEQAEQGERDLRDEQGKQGKQEVRGDADEQDEEAGDPLLEALLAGPCHREDLLAVAEHCCEGQDAVKWISGRIAQYEVYGLVQRYPDGRYGPVVK
ncbi:MAG: DNA-processing protein DprA [Coriobacteriia bacterium]|nr:DNA-processing protein DprA [Coriobacteriia bacterium]